MVAFFFLSLLLILAQYKILSLIYMPKCAPKAVVFDLDETIGHFQQIFIFALGLQTITRSTLTAGAYHRLFDIFPKIFRPGLFQILTLLKKAKQKDKCLKVIIYTNNMGPRSWTLLIKRYLEKRVNYPLFDRVITAYRPGTKENCRTTHSKTLHDLLRCAKLPANTQIVFLDDQIHPSLRSPNVRYIHVNRYSLGIPFPVMVDKFLESQFGKAVVQNNPKGQFTAGMLNLIFKKLGGHYRPTRTSVNQADLRYKKLIENTIKRFVRKDGKSSRKKQKKKLKNKTLKKRH
jgi:hypothetical protein